jgi:hypothetical protein
LAGGRRGAERSIGRGEMGRRGSGGAERGSSRAGRVGQRCEKREEGARERKRSDEYIGIAPLGEKREHPVSHLSQYVDTHTTLHAKVGVLKDRLTVKCASVQDQSKKSDKRPHDSGGGPPWWCCCVGAAHA